MIYAIAEYTATLSGKLARKATSLSGVPSQGTRPVTLLSILTQGAALCSNVFGQNSTVERFVAPASERKYDASVRTTVTSTPAPSAFRKTATLDLMAPNDEAERRGVAPTTNEADLSRSSTPSLAQRRRGPRSLEPIVRFHTTPDGKRTSLKRMNPRFPSERRAPLATNARTRAA
jgi:hypothetical protein